MNIELFNDTMTFDHFGMAVTDFEPSVTFYRQMGYSCTEPVCDPVQNVDLVLCQSDMLPDIELVKPISDTSPIHTFLKSGSESFYHICFRVKDVANTLDQIKKTNRIICIKNAQPAVLFENRKVSFYYIAGVGICEFLEAKK